MIEHKMLQIFGGNMAAYGHDEGRAVHKPVTDRLLRRHLEGVEGIGIYPTWSTSTMTEEGPKSFWTSHDRGGSGHDHKWWVKWGCCDIDTGNWTEAYSLATALKAMGFVPFIERSRSKGWHVWVFVETPIEAKYMRRALKVAYAAINLPAREANPKQEKMNPGQLGNYVRLPFKGGRTEAQERQTVTYGWDATQDGTPMSAEFFFEWFTNESFTPKEAVEHWASRWVEPEKVTLNGVPALTDDQVRNMFKHMPNPLLEFIANGPPAGKDRSEALVALAWQMKRGGFSPAETREAVVAADKRWGKYHMRPDGDRYLDDIVERTL